VNREREKKTTERKGEREGGRQTATIFLKRENLRKKQKKKE
jgi:hypothetical protein